MAKKSFHLKSMTAYGRSTLDFPYGRLTVEIQSVNRRFLEINIGLPRLLTRYEMDLRNWITARAGRGMVNVSVHWKNENNRPFAVKPNLTLAKGVKRAWEEIKNELGFKEEIDLALLSREKDLLVYEEELDDEEIYKKALETCFFDSFSHLNAMKEKEGQKLAEDLSQRIQSLKITLSLIAKNAGGAVEKYRQKLSERLEEFFSKATDNEDKVLREVAIFAERIDITEEIVRFQSHLEQFEETLIKPLENETETKGKTLDFIVQELNREINTIGSKTADKTTTQHVISVKSELEKIREQIQNIE